MIQKRSPENDKNFIWSAYVARIAKGRSTLEILTHKQAEKSPLGWRRRTWEDNIRIDLRIGVNANNWIDSVQ